MGKTYEELDEKLIDFIERQKVFFVASAPLMVCPALNHKYRRGK